LPPGLQGLTAKEAAARLVRFGPNLLVARERLVWLKRLIGLVADPMALMLAAAALLYFALGAWSDGVIMAIALIPVLGVDVFLAARSRAALAKLAQAVAPMAQVVREGVSRDIATVDLVPGDVLRLNEGDVVHADGVVRFGANLALDESSLTGESEPQRKQPADVDRAPTQEQQVFAGSLVLAGHGFAEVAATGARTHFGNIATLVAGVDASPSPLQKRTGKLVRVLSAVAVVVAIGVFGLGLAHGAPWQTALLNGISLAMAAIPEEYPLVLTLFLSVGAWRLGRRGLLVRRLASVETLGSTTVICTDKTGTLTAGHFELDETVCLDPTVTEARLLEVAILASEAAPVDPMERAIDVRAAARGVDPVTVRATFRLVCDHDFDPVGKHMSHGWAAVDGNSALVAAKGALEGILVHCTITPAERTRAEQANARLAARGMRVLAVAVKTTPALTKERSRDEAELRLIGLLGYRDPLRPEVRAAVAECREAGISVRMITGDHALTAHAIATAAGFASDSAVATGAELAALAPGAFAEKVARTTVFARISPVQKYAIVAAFQAAGDVVAMTGDGINDAPALRLADIGISMGKRGTEVARAASDLVLLDDNFASIVSTVREGRHIFTNIQAAFLYILAFHVPVVALALCAPALGLPLLLLPVHLVWLELVIHPVSAIVFQAEPAPPGLMQRPPRSPSAPLLPRLAMLRSTAVGVVLTLAVLWLYWSRQANGEDAARSVAWATLLLGYQVLVLVEWAALRGSRSNLLPHRPLVWWVWFGCGASLPLAIMVPPIARVLHLEPISLADWAVALLVAVAATGWRAVLDHLRPITTARQRRRPGRGRAGGENASAKA